MKAPFAASLLALSLAACSHAGSSQGAPAATPDAAAQDANTAQLAAALPAYHWRLQHARGGRGRSLEGLAVAGQAPLQLDFIDGRIALSNLCNRMSGGYTLAGTTLDLGRMASTLMACVDPARGAQEALAAQVLAGQFELALSGEATASPQLTLSGRDGTVLVLSGEPTAQTRYGSAGERMFLEVAAHDAPCSHPLMPDHRCLQVREVHYDDHGIRQASAGTWQPLYQDIEGYRHHDGVRNVLRLQRYTRNHLPADAPRYAYVLDMVVESDSSGR